MANKRELVTGGIYTTHDKGQARVLSVTPSTVEYQYRQSTRGRWKKEIHSVSRRKWWGLIAAGDKPVRIDAEAA